jgi:hypothetical protein
MKTITVGDRVMFSRKFCQSIGAYTGFFPFAVGTVVAIDGQFARIQWEGVDEEKGALVCNLIRKDRRHLEPN